MVDLNFDSGTLFLSDNLPVLRGMNSKTVDLIYLDPPFNSKRQYKAPIGSKAEGQKFDDTWRWTDLDDAWLGEISRRNPALSTVIHAARMTQGKGTAAYLTMMGIRLLEMRRVLKDTGSIYLHCDDTANSYLRMSMDAVFGTENFRNEIIWKRQSSNNASRSRAGRIADHILFYSTSKDSVWNGGHHALTEKEKGRYRQDEHGRLYKADDLTAPVPTPSRMFKWRGQSPKNGWRHSLEALEEMDARGEIIYKRDGMVRLDGRKRYMKDGGGQKLQSIWIDIHRVGNTSRERTGWATQKPLSLLQRIIKASSNPGDLVLDPFAGCATCLVAAEIEGRKWIGIEMCEASNDILQVRLAEADLGVIGTTTSQAKITKHLPKRTDIDPAEVKRMNGPPRYNSVENRQRMFGRQEGRCNGCENIYQYKDFEVDHIVPVKAGGGDQEDNLQLLCGNCNRRKGDSLWDKFKAIMREETKARWQEDDYL